MDPSRGRGGQEVRHKKQPGEGGTNNGEWMAVQWFRIKRNPGGIYIELC